MEELFQHRVSNIVFMGMGEPMLNLASVLEAHRCLNEVLFVSVILHLMRDIDHISC